MIRSVLAALVAASIAAAAEPSAPPEPAATGLKGADPALLQSVRSVAERIGSLVRARSASPLTALRADAATRAAEAKARAERWLPPADAEARGRAWRDLGLGTGREPADLVLALASDLDGIGLDADGLRVLVDPERMQAGEGKSDPDADADSSVLLVTGVAPDEAVVGHYAAHGFLDPPPWPAPPTTDALLARQALAEGGANVAALVFLFGGVGLESEVLGGKLRPDDPLGGRLVPESVKAVSPVVGAFLEFVYQDGFDQAAKLVKLGDFGRLALERKRRATTRDILHLDRSAAEPVELSPPTLPAGSGLTVVHRDALGEEGIVALVAIETGKDNLGLIAGDGWAGDALWRLESPGQPEGGATVWSLAFRTEEDAKDMEYALERCLASRFPGDAMADTPGGGKKLARPDRIYRLSRVGSTVSLRVAVPSIDSKFDPPPTKKGTAARGGHPVSFNK